MLQQAWTEPFVVLGLAVVVFAACRSPSTVPWLFGGFVVLKQYLVLAVPASLLLVRHSRDVFRFLVRASIVAAAVTLPFVAWNARGFWNSVVTLQVHQPFRLDALSYLAWWTLRGHDRPPATIAFLAAALAASLGLSRLPRTPAGFASMVALTFLAFFAFEQAGVLQLLLLRHWSVRRNARGLPSAR